MGEGARQRERSGGGSIYWLVDMCCDASCGTSDGSTMDGTNVGTSQSVSGGGRWTHGIREWHDVDEGTMGRERGMLGVATVRTCGIRTMSRQTNNVR